MDDNVPSSAPAFLAGGGVAGALVRRMDWAASPLGEPETWPAGLRNAVALCLGAVLPMAVFWGPGLIVLFNDAWMPLLRTRDPATLMGTPAAAAPHVIWQTLLPHLQKVMQTGAGINLERQRLELQRDGAARDMYLSTTLNPIRDDTGATAGVLSVSMDATGHVATERRLRESESYLRLVLDNSVNGLYGVDRDGATTFCNAVFLRMLGFAREEDAIGRKLHDIIHHSHPDGTHYDVADCPIYSSAQSGQPRHVDDELFYRLDGSSFPVEYWVRPTTTDGQVDGAVCTFIDVTERRLAEGALRESEARFRLIADSAPVPMWVTKLDRKRAFVNRAYVDFLGISYEQAVDFDWRTILHPDDLPRITAAQIANEASLKPFTLEARYKNVAGEWRWIRSESQPRWTADGAHDGFIGVAYDVTASKQAALELEKLNATLEARVEARTRERDLAWKHSQDLQAVVNPHGVVLAANDAWYSVLGWQPAHIVGRSYLDFVHPGSQPSSAEALAQATRSDIGAVEILMQHRDGGTRFVSWVATPADGLIYASGRNITAEKRAAAALETAQDQLRQSQKMEAVGQLTGGIAHDFNNLLTGITGTLEVLQIRLAQGRLTDASRYITAAQGAAKRAGALTHRLLAFSRRQTLDPKITDVNNLTAGMEDLVRRTVGPSVTMEFMQGKDLWTTLVDRNQLENALLNLCINARDAMPEGGTLTIQTANTELDAAAARERDVPPGQYVVLRVADTGTGMAPEIIERAFDPFFTTKPAGQGTGLGLSMIYGFARQSGGAVYIQSGLGHGTVMSILLPRHHGPGEAVPDSIAADRSDRLDHGETVLVVDDEPTVRMLVVEVLQELGYRTLEAGDGSAALELLGTGARVDILITDVGLPGGISGRQVAEDARRTRPDLKVLLITGYAENAAAQDTPRTQMLLKPFTMDALTRRIRALNE